MSKNSLMQSDILNNMLSSSREDIAKKWLISLGEYSIEATGMCQLTKIRSPLLYAVKYQADNSLILVLLRKMQQHQVNFNNSYDKFGYSILSLAVKTNNIHLVKLLFNYDYPLYWDKNQGATSPLHIAARYNNKDIINIMLPYTTRQLGIHSNNKYKLSPLKYILYHKEEKYAITY